MNEPTLRQKRAVATEIAILCTPMSFDEAGRLLSDLRQTRDATGVLIQNIVAAIENADDDLLGKALIRAKPRIRHGAWLMFLGKLAIHPRRAQRLIAKNKLQSRYPSLMKENTT